MEYPCGHTAFGFFINSIVWVLVIQRDAVSVNRFSGRGPDGHVIYDNLLYTHVEKKFVNPQLALTHALGLNA